MAQANLRYVIVSDTETSGLPSKGGKGKPEVKAFWDILLVEVAAVVVDLFEMKIVKEYDAIIKPYKEDYIWSPAAEQTHGLSQNYLNDNGLDIEDVYYDYKNILTTYKNNKVKAVLCGHNFQGFDIPFIEGLFEFHKDDLWEYVRWVEDTQKMAYYRATEQTDYKLGTCCRKEGVELVDAHRALNDTRANALLFMKYISVLRGEGAAQASTQTIESRFRETFQLAQ